MKPKIAVVLLTAAALLAQAAGAVERVDTADIITPITGDEIDLEVFPKPREEAYSGKALRLGDFSIDCNGQEGTPAARLIKELAELWGAELREDGKTMVTLGLLDAAPAKWKPDPQQGYRLKVGQDAGRASIDIRGGGAAGLFYGVQTLRQLVHKKNGAHYVREADIEDWPAVKYRGFTLPHLHPAEGLLFTLGITRFKANLYDIQMADELWPIGESRYVSQRQRIVDLLRELELQAPEKKKDTTDDLLEDFLGETEKDSPIPDTVGNLLKQRQTEMRSRLQEQLEQLDEAREKYLEDQPGRFAEMIDSCRFQHVEVMVTHRPRTGAWEPDKNYLKRLTDLWTLWHKAGVRRFLISFDDDPGLKIAVRKSNDTFATQQAETLLSLDKWVNSQNPAGILYLRHQKASPIVPPFRNMRCLEAIGFYPDQLAANLVEEGLPKKIQISWIGADDWTPRIRAAHADQIRETFGRPPSHLYFHTRRYGFDSRPPPTPAHEPELASRIELLSVASDWSYRIYVLSWMDWAWNPDGYDPERSLKVASREVIRTRSFAKQGSIKKAYAAYMQLRKWMYAHEHPVATGTEGRRMYLIAPDQGTRSIEELEKIMLQDKEFYDEQFAVLRRHFNRAGHEHIRRIESRYSNRLSRLTGLLDQLKRLPTAKATPLSGRIVMDGKLDEPEWQTATAYTGFKGWPPRGGQRIKADPNTSFRVLYSKTHLYVGVRCEEPSLDKIVATEEKKGELLNESDRLTLIIDHAGKKQRGVYLTTTINGQPSTDVFLPGDPGSGMALSWADAFQVSTGKENDAWIAEFAIPFDKLQEKDRPRRGTRWGFNVIRYRKVAESEEPLLLEGMSSWSQERMGQDRKLSGPTWRGQIEMCGTLVFE